MTRSFAALACACAFILGSAQGQSPPQKDPWIGDWVGNVPGVGKLALELRPEYEGRRSGELFWLFETLPIQWEVQGDQLTLFSSPSYSAIPSEPVLSFKRSDDGHLHFQEGGVLTGTRFDFFREVVFSPIGTGTSTFADLSDFRRDGNQRERFVKQGELQPLPESFPAPFMDASVLLFRYRNHELYALLRHPGLSADVLSATVSDVLDPRGNQEMQFLGEILGAHPHLADADMKRLFAIPDDPFTWRAIALNPSAPKTYLPLYLDRVKNGEPRIRSLVARDKLAPRAAWEIAIAPGEQYALQELARNPNAPADMLAQVSTDDGENAAQLAGNAATPKDVLERVSHSTDKQVLWALLRNTAAPTDVIARAIHTLATSKSANERSTGARDERIDPKLLEPLSRDVNISVRVQVAMNSNTPAELLTSLANDPYRLVSERARDNLAERFPEKAASLTSGWKPLDELKPYMDFNEEFWAVVKAGDVDRARELIAITQDEETTVKPTTVIAAILTGKGDFDKFSPVLLEVLKAAGPEASEVMYSNPELTAKQLAWMNTNGLFTPRSAGRALYQAAKQGKADVVQEILRTKAGSTLSVREKTEALFAAVATRNSPLIETLLNSGAKSDMILSDRMAAVDLAAKLYYFDGLKLLDETGKYRGLLADFRKEFPPTDKSPFLGTWSNRKDSFGASAFHLYPDASGILGASIAALPLVWKQVGETEIQLFPIGPNGIDRNQKIELRYDVEKKQLLPAQSQSDGYYHEIAK